MKIAFDGCSILEDNQGKQYHVDDEITPNGEIVADYVISHFDPKVRPAELVDIFLFSSADHWRRIIKTLESLQYRVIPGSEGGKHGFFFCCKCNGKLADKLPVIAEPSSDSQFTHASCALAVNKVFQLAKGHWSAVIPGGVSPSDSAAAPILGPE